MSALTYTANSFLNTFLHIWAHLLSSVFLLMLIALGKMSVSLISHYVLVMQPNAFNQMNIFI